MTSNLRLKEQNICTTRVLITYLRLICNNDWLLTVHYTVFFFPSTYQTNKLLYMLI